METTEMFKLLDEAEARRNEEKAAHQARATAHRAAYLAEREALTQRLPITHAFLVKHNETFTSPVRGSSQQYDIPVEVCKELLTWIQDPDYLAPYPCMEPWLSRDPGIMNELIAKSKKAVEDAINKRNEDLENAKRKTQGLPSIAEQRKIDKEADIMQQYHSATFADIRIVLAILFVGYLCSLFGWLGHKMSEFAWGIFILAFYGWPITLLGLWLLVKLFTSDPLDNFEPHERWVISRHLAKKATANEAK